MKPPFKLEGPICFARCPPGFDIQIQLYDIDQDGSKNFILNIVPIGTIELEPDDHND